jgi:hypothetical protein
MYIFKIIGVGHLIVKKLDDRNEIFLKKFKATIYITHIFYFSSMLFNSTLTPQNMQLSFNLGLKWPNKKLKNQIKFF